MKKFTYTILAFSPILAMAQSINTSYVDSILSAIKRWVDVALPIIIGIALLVFLWGVLQYVLNAGDDTAREEGKKKMIYGIIGLFVMVAIWGLVGVLASTLGVQTGGTVSLPQVPL